MNVEPKRWNWMRRITLGVNDPAPFQDPAILWRTIAQAATIGMFAIVVGVVFYVMHSLLVPVLSALVVAMTLGPLLRAAEKRGVPDWISAIVVVTLLIGIVYAAIISLAQPIADLTARASEIGTAIKDKFTVLERPIAALKDLKAALPGQGGSSVTVAVNETNMIAGAVVYITPAIGQLLLFFGSLFFFILGRTDFRRYVINMFETREGRLRTLKILNDIESNLSGYLLTVTCINLAVGVVTAIAASFMGLPTPLLWGALAFAFNYIPYVGPAIMDIILLIIGLLTFPTLLSALVPAAFFVALTAIEGHFITPNIIGRRLLLHPLAVFMMLAFWTWMWGFIGAFLAMPILIIVTVVSKHLYPQNEHVLP
ncbi:MAG: AI-2E family transporter [Pseudorhodoplanes sp.]